MFTTKMYTRPLLVSELKKLDYEDFSTASALAYALSPRAGVKSAKVNALYTFLGGKKFVAKIFNQRVSSKSIKSAILSSLKNS